MKVIILAAEVGQVGSKLPRCLTKVSENTTILERQVRMLNLLGFKNDQIFIVIGSKGAWGNISESDLNSCDRLQILVNESNSVTNSVESLNIAIRGAIRNESILVIHGDLYFDILHIEKMMDIKGYSSILSKRAIYVGEVGYRLETDHSNSLIAFGNQNIARFPWHIYCGMVLLQAQDVERYKEFSGEISVGSGFEALVKVIGMSRFKVIDYSLPKSGTPGAISNTIDLTGGSFANLSRRMLIRKQADENGRQKLINEILWLQNLPTKIACFFPTVIDSDIVSRRVWFDMPWYNVPSLRKKILLGDIEVKEICDNVGKVLDFVFLNLYSIKFGPPPEDWVIQTHIRRVYDRLVTINKTSNMMSKLIMAKTIYINGECYENLPRLLYKITQFHQLLEIVKPTDLRMIHGDLHFQNILFGPNEEGTEFILADPRGEIKGSDVYYDMGKLWHSFNGLYDCIHTDQFDLITNTTNGGETFSADLTYFNPQWVSRYHAIGRFVEKKVLDYDIIRSDPNWKLKVHFSEVMHFSSVMIFHLKGTLDESRAAAMYLTAVRLMNEFFSNYSINDLQVSESVLGFKTIEQYLNNLTGE
jgi:choline kinase